MKRFFKILFVLIFLFYADNVLAASRDDKNTKTAFTLQGKTFYAGVEVDFNNHSRVGFIGDVDISYDESNNMLIAKVKRSQINSVIESTDTNVYLNIELNVDYHDFQSDEYTIFSNEDSSVFWINQNGRTSKDSYIEFLSTAVEIVGGIPYKVTKPGTLALYKGNLLENGITGDYSADSFNNQEKEVLLKNLNMTFSIIEDVRADMQNIESIDVGEVNEGSIHKENISINNFYQITDNNAKTLMSLSMYDGDGKPIEVNDGDMVMKVDDSDNTDTIANYFEEKDADKMHVLTFEYAKEFVGKASVRVYVGDILGNDETAFIYYFNQASNIMEVISKDLSIDDDGYVTFDVSHFSEYVVASSTNKLVSDTSSDVMTIGSLDKSDLSDYIYYIILGVVAILLIVVLFLRKKKQKNKEVQTQVDEISISHENDNVSVEEEILSQDDSNNVVEKVEGISSNQEVHEEQSIQDQVQDDIKRD